MDVFLNNNKSIKEHVTDIILFFIYLLNVHQIDSL